MKKYEFTGKTKEWNGRTLHRIRALVDVRDGVRAGDLGGWIESEENLEQSGTSWVGGNAVVGGNAKVGGNVVVGDNARVDGNARINSHEDLLVVGPIGSRGDYTTFARAESGIFVKCGCFGGMLEKFEEAIPSADDFDLYGVYPAIDACVALSELVHSRLSGETLEHAVEVSKTSITTVAMLEMTQAGREMSDEELKENPAVEQEWDIQWEIFRLLAECEERDIELIKGLRADLREAGESNIGIIFQQ